MSYCRFVQCDVYVYDDCNGGVTCCGCSLADCRHTNMETHKEMAAHLQKHVGAGHDVPQHVIDFMLTSDGPDDDDGTS